MLNTKQLRSEYKIIKNKINRDAMIGGLIIAIIGAFLISLMVRGACLLIMALPHTWLAVR